MKSLQNPSDRQEILERLRTIEHDTQRVWGTMTAPEMICHLADSFRTALHERDASTAGGVMARTVVKWIALYAPLSWPKGVPTRPENDPHESGTKPAGFKADVEDLIGLCERFANASPSTWAPHPVFGVMTHTQWQRWGYLHTDHHLRQFGV